MLQYIEKFIFLVLMVDSHHRNTVLSCYCTLVQDTFAYTYIVQLTKCNLVS